MREKDNSLREYKNEQKKNHQEKVREKIQKVDHDLERKVDYKIARNFRWYDSLIIIGISLSLIGIGFLIGIFGIKDLKKTSWLTFGFCILSLLTFVVLGFVRNRMAVNFYGDRRMRYRKTLTPEEGTIQRIKWITLICSGIFLIVSLIIYYA